MKPLFFTVRGLPLVLEPGIGCDGVPTDVFAVRLGPSFLGTIEETVFGTIATIPKPSDTKDTATTTGPDQTQRIEFALTWLLDTLIARSFVRADQLGLTKKPLPFGDVS